MEPNLHNLSEVLWRAERVRELALRRYAALCRLGEPAAAAADQALEDYLRAELVLKTAREAWRNARTVARLPQPASESRVCSAPSEPPAAPAGSPPPASLKAPARPTPPASPAAPAAGGAPAEPPDPPTARLRFARWLVETGRLSEW